MALAPNDVAGTERDATIRLVTAHRSGDPDAFEAMVHAHYPLMLASARRRLGNMEDAEDAVQETFLRAYRGLPGFGRSGDWRLGAWLNRILHNVCAELPTRRRPTVPFDERLADAQVGHDDAGELVSDPVALAAVTSAITTLPLSQRRAFLLRMVDDLPYDVVAGELGITEENARARVARARSTLQRLLAGSAALSSTLVAVPLVAASSLRASLRRLLTGGDPAARSVGTALNGAPALPAGGAQAPAGVQLVSQLSASPLVQAAVMMTTAAGGKAPAVLGVLAGLATAGGLTVPAVTAAPAAPPPVTVVAVAPTANVGKAPTGAAPSGQASGAVLPAPQEKGLVTPGWAAAAMRASAPTGASTSAGGPTSSAGAAAPTQAGAGAGATAGGGGTVTVTPQHAVSLVLPAGTCTGVPDFPSVTPPTTSPALSSDTLATLLTTGAVNLTSVGGAPSFESTASVTATAGAATQVGVKVGTCLAQGGSILVVNVRGTTGDLVQLVGSLVGAPQATTGPTPQGVSARGVAYLFRGTVTQISGTPGPDGTLPWHLTQSFVAEVEVAEPANTATLTVAFLQQQAPAGTFQATGDTSPTATQGAAAATQSTTSATNP